MQYWTMYRLADAQWSAAKVPVVRDLRLSVVANPNQHGAGFTLFQIRHLECMAGTTGLEPATSAVTGQRPNPPIQEKLNDNRIHD